MFKSQNKKHFKGFTLVELIIVITILSILATIAFISFQGYTKDARDGIRMSDIKQIYNGLSIYKTQTEKTLLPDNYINIQSGTTTISYQGYAGASVLRTLKISGGKDPGTKDYYIYTTDVNTKKAQLMTYMETSDKDVQLLSQLKDIRLINKANAVTNTGYYQDKKIYVYGDKIGILTNNKVPLQETTTNTGIDITSLTGSITTYFGGNVYSGGVSTSTGLTLINQINGAVNNTLPCSNTTYNGYIITSLQDKQSKIFTKTGAIDNGTQTGSIQATCNNGTLSYSSETIQTSCNTNYTLNGNECKLTPVLLLHGDNVSTPTSFLDNSPNNKAITRNGDTTQVVGGEFAGGGYFDGNSYLTIPGSSDLQISGGQWTFDIWVYPISYQSSGYNTIYSWIVDGSNWFQIFLRGNNGGVGISSATSNIATGATVGSVPLNQWTHIAMVGSGTNANIFINGQNVGNIPTNIPLGNTTTVGKIGWDGNTGRQLNGYLDEYRISKGVARWTNNFTPPTSEYTTDSYTKLLLHFNGNGNSFTDSSGTSKVITAYGNSTQFSPKFGSGAMYFDGNGDYLSLADSEDWNFGTGDFTIDYWLNINSFTNYRGIVGAYTTNGSIDTGWVSQLGTSNRLRFFCTSNSCSGMGIDYQTNFTISPNTWYHIALVRNGNNIKYYLNGVGDSSGGITYSGNIPSLNPLLIGNTDTYQNLQLNGYIDELRIVKGTAVWTSNFTTPTSPY